MSNDKKQSLTERVAAMHGSVSQTGEHIGCEFKEGKNGVTYPGVVIRDTRVPWRFQTVHPMAVAIILDNIPEAEKAVERAMKPAPKRQVQQP